MSNYPPGVTDADIDRHFGEAPEGLADFLEREQASRYYDRYEREDREDDTEY